MALLKGTGGAMRMQGFGSIPRSYWQISSGQVNMHLNRLRHFSPACHNGRRILVLYKKGSSSAPNSAAGVIARWLQSPAPGEAFVLVENYLSGLTAVPSGPQYNQDSVLVKVGGKLLMSARRQRDCGTLLHRARGGQGDCLGELLERYRNYLYVVARTQIDLHLSVRASPSDVVQETFLQAARKFQSFRGDSEGELLAWLRRILARSIVNAYAHHVRSKKRDVRRDRSIRLTSASSDESSRRVDSALAAGGTSPSGAAMELEYSAQVADRLAQLPKSYREVIILRNLEGLPFEEVAQRMGKTSVAVRQLWTRAIRRLKLPNEKE